MTRRRRGEARARDAIRVVEPERAGVCEPEREHGDERLGDAPDAEALAGRRISPGKRVHAVAVAETHEHTRHARGDELVVACSSDGFHSSYEA